MPEMSFNIVGLSHVPDKVNLNLNNGTSTWNDLNVKSDYWSVANPVVRRLVLPIYS